MAGKNVDTEALDRAAQALGNYIADVQQNIKKMKDAAVDCKDNMGGDAVSEMAVSRLESCAAELSKTIGDAQELQKKIIDRKRAIEDSYGSSL